MSDRMNVTVAGGKYTFVMRADYSTTALRYGEPWPAFEAQSPDNLHFALAAEVMDLRTAMRDLVETVESGLNSGLILSVDGRRPEIQSLATAKALLAQHGGAA